MQLWLLHSQCLEQVDRAKVDHRRQQLIPRQGPILSILFEALPMQTASTAFGRPMDSSHAQVSSQSRGLKTRLEQLVAASMT